MSDHRSALGKELEKLQLVLLVTTILALIFWCILVAVLIMYSGALFDIFQFIANLTKR